MVLSQKFESITDCMGMVWLNFVVENKGRNILCLQEERKQASFEQLLKVANSEREVHKAVLNFVHSFTFM